MPESRPCQHQTWHFTHIISVLPTPALEKVERVAQRRWDSGAWETIRQRDQKRTRAWNHMDCWRTYSKHTILLSGAQGAAVIGMTFGVAGESLSVRPWATHLHPCSLPCNRHRQGECLMTTPNSQSGIQESIYQLTPCHGFFPGRPDVHFTLNTRFLVAYSFIPLVILRHCLCHL